MGLGPMDRSMLPLILRWVNDPLTAELDGDTFQPFAAEAFEAIWAPLLRGERPGWVGFAIWLLAEERPIGMLNLRDVLTPQRTAEFGITIGDPRDRGLGYGTEATRLALGFAFRNLGVNNVLLDTMSGNLAAIRAYAKAGFREIGRIREARRFGPHRYDVVLMDCLASEFVADERDHADGLDGTRNE
ncbi:MAG: GNAT family N-acetyltransferase [Thermomicrobiales bacterium]